MSWLLILVPVALSVHWLMPDAHSLVFGSAALAIIPLAGWMGRATEALAARAGEGVGGLLNATFGNAAELMIALAALRPGLYDVVKASMACATVLRRSSGYQGSPVYGLDAPPNPCESGMRASAKSSGNA